MKEGPEVPDIYTTDTQ